jgi:hypothetical protein
MSAKMVKTKTPGIFNPGSGYVAVACDAHGSQCKCSFPTMTAAREWKATATADRDRGETQPNTRVTLHEFARAWVERYRGTGRRGFRERTRGPSTGGCSSATRWPTSRQGSGSWT